MSIVRMALALVAALALGIVIQVLFAQANEEGSFDERVGAVLQKQFGFAEETPDAAPAADVAGRNLDEGPRLSPDIEAAARAIADRYVAATRDEIARLKHDLLRQSDLSGRDSFWTDVRLNTLFLVLGLGAPALLRRVGIKVG